MPKKIKLTNLKVKSFVTLENGKAREVKGGASGTNCATWVCDTWCECETLKTDCSCQCSVPCSVGCTAYTDCYPVRICP